MGGQLPGLVPVKQGEQLGGGSAVGQFVQGLDGVGAGVIPQHCHGGGELLARLGVPSPPAQRRPAMAWARAAERVLPPC